MKTYFVLRDFFNDAFNAEATAIKLNSWKVDGVQTLTPQFFLDTQGLPNLLPRDVYEFCDVDADGSNAVAPAPGTPGISFNPFKYDFQLEYNLDNGFSRGIPIGTRNGNDYGSGILKIGVDKSMVSSAAYLPQKGAFFIDIDYSKDLDIRFNIVLNNSTDELFVKPTILRRYKIAWTKSKCLREFSYYNVRNQTTYNDDEFGFLSGIKDAPSIDFTDIPCGPDDVNCPNKERTRSFAIYVDIPKATPDVDTIKECCYNAIVLAETGASTDYEKNDFTGVFHQRQVPMETCDFVLVNVNTSAEYPLASSALGTFKNFGSIPGNPDLKTFVLEWKKVLIAHGAGTYTIVKRVDVSGVQYEIADINYTLKQYTIARADKTIRLDAATNGFMQRIGVEFKNSGFTTSLRFGGFFGRRDPKFTQDNVIYGNYKKTQVSVIQSNNYQMQSDMLPSCMTTQIWDFILFANDIFVNDYNLNNHLRDFIKFPVVLNETKEPAYSNKNTKAVLNMTFMERIGDNLKRNY